MYPPVQREYFLCDARHLARALIGAFLVREERGGAARVARIVETEAYRGPRDAACHARFGLTSRTRTLLGPPGFAYVFLVYGMHECFNVVCLREGAGHAVLVRAAEPVAGIELGVRCDGPGKLTRAMGITRAHDGGDLTRAPLYVSAAAVGKGRARVAVSARVGVAYAGADAERSWRFFDRESAHVSRPPASAIGLGRRSRGA
ncbi:MAG: DNA-3-methyladenine glycosylase [Polyangiaceae bacterium]